MHSLQKCRLLNIWLGADIEIINLAFYCVFIVFTVFLGNLVHVVSRVFCYIKQSRKLDRTIDKAMSLKQTKKKGLRYFQKKSFLRVMCSCLPKIIAREQDRSACLSSTLGLNTFFLTLTDRDEGLNVVLKH